MILPKEIFSDRLKIVPISLGYLDDVFSEITLDITKYMSVPVTGNIEDTKIWIKEKSALYKKGDDFTIAILDKKTGEFIGGGGLHHTDRKTPEFGIWIKKSAHGYKYGREAITALKNWADINLDYEYIKYPVAVKNISSRKIPESLGGVVFRKYYDRNGAGQKMLLAEYRIYKQ